MKLVSVASQRCAGCIAWPRADLPNAATLAAYLCVARPPSRGSLFHDAQRPSETKFKFVQQEVRKPGFHFCLFPPLAGLADRMCFFSSFGMLNLSRQSVD